jgi:phage recombination protein Bet
MTKKTAIEKANNAAVTVPHGTQGASLLARMAARFGVDPTKMMDCLKATAFRSKQGEPVASNEQIMALCIVADQYKLNPWTKEIYAFPDKSNGIVPVVGVDGWARIINEHEQFDGMTFDDDAESCTCTIYRKDRTHPVTVTEYLSECKRNTGPWASHPKRMLRHKAMVQAARLAFGYAGIYDADEGERIVAATEAATRPVIEMPVEALPEHKPEAEAVEVEAAPESVEELPY